MSDKVNERTQTLINMEIGFERFFFHFEQFFIFFIYSLHKPEKTQPTWYARLKNTHIQNTET